MSIKILAMVSLAVCSLSVDAEAYTIKQNACYRTDGFSGLCTVECDVGTVVVGGGCFTPAENVGFSQSYPSSDRQWVCRAAAKVGLVIAYAICQCTATDRVG